MKPQNDEFQKASQEKHLWNPSGEARINAFRTILRRFITCGCSLWMIGRLLRFSLKCSAGKPNLPAWDLPHFTGVPSAWQQRWGSGPATKLLMLWTSVSRSNIFPNKVHTSGVVGRFFAHDSLHRRPKWHLISSTTTHEQTLVILPNHESQGSNKELSKPLKFHKFDLSLGGPPLA